MKNRIYVSSLSRTYLPWLLPVVLIPGLLQADETAVQPSANYVVFGGTGTDLNGSETAWRARQGYRSNVRAGIETLHYEQALGENWFMEMDVRALIDAQDYSFDAVFEKEGFNRTRIGFEQARYWSDARTVSIPGMALLEPFDASLALDRSKFYIETTFFPSDDLDLTLRYVLRQRDGDKASSSWSDSGLSGSTRNVVPSFRRIDEVHHTVELEAERRWESTTLEGALRWDRSEVDNSLNVVRESLQANERYFSHAEALETDTLSAHTVLEHRVSEKLLLNASGMFSRLDGDLSGDRIWGDSFFPTYVPGVAYYNSRRRDHGFIDLAGDFDLDQYVANFSALYQAAENWVITPSLRFETTTQDGSTTETETNVGAHGAAPTEAGLAGRSSLDYDSAAAEIGARYTGLKNWSFYADAFASYGEGDQFERQYEVLDPTDPDVDRNTDYERTNTKFTLGGTWYAHSQVTVAFQAYHKVDDTDYDHSSQDADEYPGFIVWQKRTTDDFNMRVNWRVLSNLTSISRFDYQQSTIDSKGFELSRIESSDRERFVYSETLSYQPSARLSLFGSINYVQDTLSTPVSDAYDSRNSAVVAENQMDYIYGQLTGVYVWDERTELTVSVGGVLSDNAYDNSAVSVPYGNDLEEYNVTASVSKWLDDNKRLILQYGYYDYEDGMTSGERDYSAHVFAAKYEYRF